MSRNKTVVASVKERVYTAAQCREIDQAAMQALNLSGLQLMQRAAEAALAMLLEKWPDAQRLNLYCGPGNNGGDGYLLAAKAQQLGYKVHVWECLPPASKLAQATQLIAREQGVEILHLRDDPVSDFHDQLPGQQPDLFVDAIFGHGLTRPIEGILAELIAAINLSAIPVLALDIPSGINSDTGAVMGVAVDASASCSFIAAKLGMFTGEGPNYCGEIREEALGVPAAIYEKITPACEVIEPLMLKQLLSEPRATSHKGDFGHTAIVGGHPGMVGAVILAAMAAARSGAGRVTVITDNDHIHLIQQENPVLMSCAIAVDGVVTLPDSISALALGPGLGCTLVDATQGDRRSWSVAVFESALEQAEAHDLPLLVDADALSLLAHFPRKFGRWVLSPHPKEAATLLGVSVTEIETDRPAACVEIAQRYGGVCVLKGKGSLVSDETGRLAICSSGNWGMATAGSGDVLSGIIAAFLANGMDGYTAATLAVGVHAWSGDLAATEIAKRSMIATDLIDYLSRSFNQLEKA